MLADCWPTDIAAFVSRLVLLIPEDQIAVNIIQALEPQTDPSQAVFPVIFDIDAYQEISLGPDEVTIPERFAKLRRAKNRIFFNGLTSETIALFQ